MSWEQITPFRFAIRIIGVLTELNGATGECIQRQPSEVQKRPRVARTSQMCKCYYSQPPPGMPVNNKLLDSAPGSPISKQ